MIQERINNITMLRALSCLLIVNVHMNRLEIPFVEIFSKGGFVFNTVFLLLSGYLLMNDTKGNLDKA